MFYLDYLWKNACLTLRLMRQGEWRRIYRALHARLYVRWHGLWFELRAGALRAGTPPPPPGRVEVVTDHPVAFSSPDHAVPFGTRYNNSTNRKFVCLMNEHFRRREAVAQPAFMDLGCSGGQVVADFARLNWVAVGLEGSDYSLKHRRANWRALAGTHLFTCDICKPFQVRRKGQPAQFHLVTAWEVLEHIHADDLPQLFRNIRDHLLDGGYFVGTTNSSSSIVDGLELHQTRLSNAQWKDYVRQRFPELVVADLGLQPHQYVRFDFGEPSYLVFRKRAAAAS